MIDDRFSGLDDVHVLGSVDLMRRARRFRQLFVSTHDVKLRGLLERKLRPVEAGQRTVIIEFKGWTRNGPVVQQRDVAGDEGALRLVE